MHGETLSDTDRALYEAGCRDLDESESLDGGLARLLELRAMIAQSDVERDRLRERESELDEQIAELEAKLDARTRQLLGIGG